MRTTHWKTMVLAGAVLCAVGTADTPSIRAQETPMSAFDDTTLVDSLLEQHATYRAAGDSLQMAQTGREIANVYFRQSDLSRALEGYFEGLAVFNELDSRGDIAQNLNNIGMVHWLQDYLPQALDYFSQSIAHYEAIDDRSGLATAYNNIANVFLAQENYEHALSYYRRALAVHESLENEADAAGVHHNIGVVLIAQERHEEALDHLFQALAVKESLEDRQRIFPTYEEVGHAYLGMKAYEEALRYAKRGLVLAEQGGDIRPLMASTEMLSKIYAAMGNYAQAYAYQSRYVAAKDSLRAVEKTEAIARLQTQYETRQKEQAIYRLEQQQRMHDLRARTTRNMLLGGLAAALLLAGLLYNRSRLKQKANRLLKAQKEEISRKSQNIAQKKEALQQSLKEKELLVKEIHHRVKNNLQVISSLLSVQSYILADKKALAAVQDIHHRVEAMALVHKKLYRAEALAEIDVQDYLEDLSRFLLHAYQGKTDTVHCRVNAEDIRLTMDTAIPLGLIASELISNALEHAFPDDARGEIAVVLQEESKDAYALKVADDGVGLPPSAEERNPAAMGLSLVKKLTRQLHGSMHVASGSGTSFTIQFSETG